MYSIIRNNRPNLTDWSIITYTWIIKSVSKYINTQITKPEDILLHIDKIEDYLKNKEFKLRKTIYWALLIFTDIKEKTEEMKNINEYLRKKMMDDINQFKLIETNQIKTEKQQINWMEYEEVLDMYKKYEKENIELFEKETLNKKEFLKLNTYILLACLFELPPLRSMNWTEFKIRNVDKEKDNYMEDNNFYFNQYKNSNRKGLWVVPINDK